MDIGEVNYLIRKKKYKLYTGNFIPIRKFSFFFFFEK